MNDDGVKDPALEVLLGNGSHARRRMNLRPGVILLDLNLPKVSGLEVLRRIKSDARTRIIPVVILTASRKSRDMTECQHLGAETYLIKPVGFQNFSQVTPKLSLQWALLRPASQSTL
ncbi:MAG TPA: response regulator [Verrucomicrobiae bacterium]|jgi:CheY-like chemotaxis protein